VISGAVAWIVKLEVNLVTLKNENARQDEKIGELKMSLSEHKTHNQMQHEEFYQSKNETATALVRLATLFENMDKKLDTLLSQNDRRRKNDEN